MLETQDQEHVEGRDEDAIGEREAEQQFQADGGADDFGEVSGDDGDFGERPKRERDGAGVGVAAGLGQIAARPDR